MKQESKEAQGIRLSHARRLAGFRSARAAAMECGWAESTYRTHEAGTRTIGLDDAEKYARKFQSLGVKITAQDILFGPEIRFKTVEPTRFYPSESQIERIYAGVVGILRGVGCDADRAAALKQLLREVVEDPPDIPDGMSEVEIITAVAQTLTKRSLKRDEPQDE